MSQKTDTSAQSMTHDRANPIRNIKTIKCQNDHFLDYRCALKLRKEPPAASLASCLLAVYSVVLCVACCC
jgi:hypothetical protein